MNPMGILNWLAFVLFYSFIPVGVYINGNFNYYWDVVESAVTEDESSIVYDFIVGKRTQCVFHCDYVPNSLNCL